MRGKILFVPPRRTEQHTCQWPMLWFWRRWPVGTVWECDCGKQYVLDTHAHTGRWIWRELPVSEYREDR